MVNTLKPIMIMLGTLLCPLLTWAQEERSQISTDFPCPPEDNIKITKFKDVKNWQVVVNRPFDYKATPQSNTDNWTWTLGDLNANGDGVVTPPFWMFQNALNANKGSGIINNLPPNNSDFGPTHGHIEAAANLNGVPKKDLSDHPDQTVKVFFKKDDLHPISGTPNWFHYWREAQPIIDLLTIPGIKLWDKDNCIFLDAIPVELNLIYGGMPYNPVGNTTYGFSKFNPAGFLNVDPFGPPCNDNSPPHLYSVGYKVESLNVTIGEGCGFRKNLPANPSADVNGNIEGIFVLYSTIAHEVEHTIITCEVWANGYDSALDEPLPNKDHYRDGWEEQTNLDNAGTPGYCPFTIGVNDKYNVDNDPVNLGNCALETAGTNYEEIRCRNKENALDIEPAKTFDWSFDPTAEIQGKQW
ncbi:MAG: hypothetical protein R2830_10145 [Saprospiraceae bacterium]